MFVYTNTKVSKSNCYIWWSHHVCQSWVQPGFSWLSLINVCDLKKLFFFYFDLYVWQNITLQSDDTYRLRVIKVTDRQLLHLTWQISNVHTCGFKQNAINNKIIKHLLTHFYPTIMLIKCGVFCFAYKNIPFCSFLVVTISTKILYIP